MAARACSRRASMVSCSIEANPTDGSNIGPTKKVIQGFLERASTVSNKPLPERGMHKMLQIPAQHKMIQDHPNAYEATLDVPLLTRRRVQVSGTKSETGGESAPHIMQCNALRMAAKHRKLFNNSFSESERFHSAYHCGSSLCSLDSIHAQRDTHNSIATRCSSAAGLAQLL
jgi:hypothetical protein